MRISRKTVALLCVIAISRMPILAAGDYEITETEGTSRVNPLITLGDPLRFILKRNEENTTKEVEKKKIATKTIYLTFDDGPGRGTSNVLHALEEERVEGTMFFVGRKVGYHPSLYKKALAMPNLLIANHTYTHANGKYARFYSNATTVINDVDRAQRIIGGAKYLRLAGRNVWRLPDVYRSDYGLSTKRRSIEKATYAALSSRGYHIYGWDIEWHFDHTTGNASYGADRMADRVEALYRNKHLTKTGKIVLLAHDYMFRNESGMLKLREFIQILKSSGWQFETLASYGSSTPAVFVRQKKDTPKKVIRIAMSTKDSLKTQVKKQKQLLQLLR